MINYITKPFIWFFKLEAASGLVLLFSAIIALYLSNSTFSETYFNILKTYFFIGIDQFGLKLTVLHWINDVLMVIFFFLVTLEIKREFIQGELSNRKLYGVWLSLVEHSVWDRGVVGSNPTTPTIK